MNTKITEKERELLNKFVLYKKEKHVFDDYGEFIEVERLAGLKSEKEGYIYKSLNEENLLEKDFNKMGKFETTLTKVPPEYEETEMDKLLALRYYCSEAVPKPHLNGLEDNDWYENSMSKWLAIKDICNMQQGERLELIFLDRNFMDTTCEDNKGNTSYKPKDYFKKAIYTHTNELKGKLLCIGYAFDNEDFEFQIEYTDCDWTPLKDGKVEEAQNKHWTEFPTTTHIGWRGPMIKWSELEQLPDIYWYDEYRY